MKPIVVPVNYTANAANAARYAADLALAIGTDIHLVYVFEIPFSLAEVPVPPSAIEGLELDNVNLLRNLKRELIDRVGSKVNFTSSIETGNVQGQLAAICRAKNPLLVVMGASGDKLENVIAGSQTVQAMRHLPYPILVIPENATFHSIGKIVVACDREDILMGMPSALPFLKQLHERLSGARLEILHVVTDKDENAAELEEAYNDWKRELDGLLPILHFIHRSRVEQGIGDYLKGCLADLVIVFPKKHGLLEFHNSQSKKLVKHCAVPVMSMHE